MKTTGYFARIGEAVGELVETKQMAYGDSFGKSGKVMRILYPQGISPGQMDDALAVVRVLDKLFRIATSKDALGEDPWKDIAGYGLLGARRSADAEHQRAEEGDREKREEKCAGRAEHYKDAVHFAPVFGPGEDAGRQVAGDDAAQQPGDVVVGRGDDGGERGGDGGYKHDADGLVGSDKIETADQHVDLLREALGIIAGGIRHHPEAIATKKVRGVLWRDQMVEVAGSALVRSDIYLKEQRYKSQRPEH